MDFYQIKEKTNPRSGLIEIYPDFKVCRSKDLMIRGKSFYAIWDEEQGLWSTDEYDVQRLVDQDLRRYTDELKSRQNAVTYTRYMGDYSSKSWTEFQNYVKHISDNSHQLDETITFRNTEVKKDDYVSKRLGYAISRGNAENYRRLVEVLYDPDELAKLEWAIGAVISGDARRIQKFIVLYGEAGTGKSTILNIIQKLFEGYYTTFEAKALTSTSNAFATEVFRTNPLVAIQHDGDLSRIEDNTKLNSIVSHEEMTMNEKFKSSYTARTNCFLFMGTNKPVKITDAKSGIIRRLIDVHPTGNKIPRNEYDRLYDQIPFELGAIAQHCLDVYREMGMNFYNAYRPLDMMYQTDVFFNFVEGNFDILCEGDGITLSRAYELYKTYCDESLVDYKLAKYKFREELKNYFEKFYDVTRIDGKQVRSYYQGFLKDKFVVTLGQDNQNGESLDWLELKEQASIFDKECSECLAQYATDKETPESKWDNVKSVLRELDTHKLHYVRVPINHIVIDFDLKDKQGNKSLVRNLEAASKWPKTYAEVSKGGNGLHLHYVYKGNPEELDRVYSDGIEIKVFAGLSSLRRKLSKCNNESIAIISSGLPFRKKKKMINTDSVKSEKGLRDLIARNLRKEIHPGTKPSIDFIYKILEDAYDSGMFYDVTDLRPRILAFANNSSHQSDYCIKMVAKMHFMSDINDNTDTVLTLKEANERKNSPLVFFDVECFPNLFVVCWKTEGAKVVARMVNPGPAEMEELFEMRLVGFNNRQYDNHMLYACYMGYTVEQLYELSQKLISGSKNAKFSQAYGLSYTDVYDFASAGNKKSLKKFEIELGIHHQELGLPWDKSVDKSKWDLVGDYCCNDVNATEHVFHYLSADWTARQILAELSGLTVNDTTNSHSTKIIFGNDRTPQNEFVYTHLEEMFPGYVFENGKSIYRGEEVGEGGYVYAEPGIHFNVALLDIASMHPTSIEQLNLFGSKYTSRFCDIKNARVAIKHKDVDALTHILDGKLVPFAERAANGEFKFSDLANALKTVINSVYGLTSAKFDNAFRDKRNVDNIVAKRGALFMVDLKHAVQEKGFVVAHIKTDSIKIPNATPEIIQFVMDFGKKYGYVFEHEATYERMCLVNNAVYIARYKDGDHAGEWTATGAQFQHPYVFKKLFSHEDIVFEDMCETKSVTSTMYLDMNESLPEGEHNYVFIGKTGLFCPIKPGCGGGSLLREKDGKYYAVTGSSGYRWLEAETVINTERESDVDNSYQESLVQDAINNISNYGDFQKFVDVNTAPWEMKCGRESCIGCDKFVEDQFHIECKLGYDLSESILNYV